MIHTPMLKALCPNLEPAEETYWPECTRCGCAKEGKNTEAEAIAAWNTRFRRTPDREALINLIRDQMMSNDHSVSSWEEQFADAIIVLIGGKTNVHR